MSTNLETFYSIIRLIGALLVVIVLIFLSLRFGGDKAEKIGQNKYIKIMERTNLSKNSTINLVKIGSRTYVIQTSLESSKILLEVPKEEIEEFEKNKEEQMKKLREGIKKSPEAFTKYAKELVKGKSKDEK